MCLWFQIWTKILVDRRIWRKKGTDRRICTPLFTPISTGTGKETRNNKRALFVACDDAYQLTKNVAVVFENHVRTSKYLKSKTSCNCCFEALNLTASHVSLSLVWQVGPQGISRGPLIGLSAATRFWVAKIGANQVGKVLRPAGTE